MKFDVSVAKEERLGTCALRTSLLLMSACIACITGKENFPSVRSSAKPFFEVYCFVWYKTRVERYGSSKLTSALWRFIRSSRIWPNSPSKLTSGT